MRRPLIVTTILLAIASLVYTLEFASVFPDRSWLAATSGAIFGSLLTALFVACWRAATTSPTGTLDLTTLKAQPRSHLWISVGLVVLLVVASIVALTRDNDLGKWIATAFLIGAPVGFLGSYVESRLS